MSSHTKKERGFIVNHHLTLEDTLIERGIDGTLCLSQRGRRVQLSAQEVDMLVDWLALAPPACLDTANHSFRRDETELIMNNFIFLPDDEGVVISIWLLSF